MHVQTSEQAVAVISPPRKQNIACDACRTRKVRCVMIPGQEKCQHCQTKSYPCTFNVQRETSEKKRQGTTRRRNSESTTGAIQHATTFPSLSTFTSPTQPSQPSGYAGEASSTPMPAVYPSSFHDLSSRSPALAQTIHSSSASPPGTQFISPSLTPSQLPVQQSLTETPISQLIAYLLSPEDASPLFSPSLKGYRALPNYQQRHRLRLDDWGEVGLKLQDPAFRIEFALDLVEVYFEICHTRIALLGPARFRAQLRASLPSTTGVSMSVHPSTAVSSHSQTSLRHPHTQSSLSASSANQINPAILATVLAWGAKFSEHPLILQDRDADASGAQRSRLASSLIKKAREVAEAEKMHIVPSPDSVIVCMLLDGLHSHNMSDPDGYRAFWLNCGLRHLMSLQINNRSTVPCIVEPERMDTMVYAWWIACLADAYSSAYFRRKPVLEDNDYSIDYYLQDISRIAQSRIALSETDRSENALEIVTRPEFLDWYTAAHSMARCSREMSRQLWRPIIQTEGIPFDVLCALIRQLNGWRADHLDKVGVPGVQVNWDFLAAVAACSHDATFHVMWVILFQALRDFGMREVNEAKRAGTSLASHHLAAQYATTEAQVREEAINGASRIAGLTNLLTQSSYLRLDPNIMHYSIYAAGKLLAEFGREEVNMCIRGLQQYGISYEDAFDQAAEIQRMYAASSQVEHHAAQVWEGVNGTHGHQVSFSIPGETSYSRETTLAPMQRRS